MSVALIELVEMTATLNVVVSINSTTVMQTYWTVPFLYSFTKKRRFIWTTLKTTISNVLTSFIFVMKVIFAIHQSDFE